MNFTLVKKSLAVCAAFLTTASAMADGPSTSSVNGSSKAVQALFDSGYSVSHAITGFSTDSGKGVEKLRDDLKADAEKNLGKPRNVIKVGSGLSVGALFVSVAAVNVVVSATSVVTTWVLTHAETGSKYSMTWVEPRAKNAAGNVDQGLSASAHALKMSSMGLLQVGANVLIAPLASAYVLVASPVQASVAGSQGKSAESHQILVGSFAKAAHKFSNQLVSDKPFWTAAKK